jgi:hypothetical protein
MEIKEDEQQVEPKPAPVLRMSSPRSAISPLRRVAPLCVAYCGARLTEEAVHHAVLLGR